MCRFICLFFLLSQVVFSQQAVLPSAITIENLKEGANSIVKESSTEVTVLNRKYLNVKAKKTVLVLNEAGLRNIDATVHYDKSVKVKNIEAKHFDASGKMIKVFKSKDFKDQSVADGFSVFTDNRKLFLDFTPIQYPFIFEFSYETERENTAFLPYWFPVENYLEGVQKSKFAINFPQELGFRYKELNFQGYDIQKEVTNTSLRFSLENQLAIKNEEYMPSYQKILPYVAFALDKFNLEGVEGKAENWLEFGRWMDVNLLKGLDELPQETVIAIKKLVGNETDPIKKAKMVYDYVQRKTRYVSIQVGIGGWKPMPAKDVDRLGYGDCKALTNYTKSLLSAVDVPSYYTVIYGNDAKKDLIEDFVSMQGNHVILTIPDKEKLLFLECTSQIAPFNYQGEFTDDRNALIITPEGGKIVKTNNVSDNDNLQNITGSYTIDNKGNIEGTYKTVSKGTQYDAKYQVERKPKTEQEEFYKYLLRNIKNLTVKSIQLKNDKETIAFTENVSIAAESYGQKINETLIFPVNAFNVNRSIPQRYRNRKNPFEIERGYTDNDDVSVTLPTNYSVDGIPETIDLKTKFGAYHFEIRYMPENNTLSYKRKMTLNRGMYDKTEYDAFRKFMEDVSKFDNIKVLLKSK